MFLPPAAQAITLWNWSFSGSNSSGTGTFTADGVTHIPNTTYQITGITGTYNILATAYDGSYTITGLSTYEGFADNTFQWSGPGSQIRLNLYVGFAFTTNGGVTGVFSVVGPAGYNPPNYTTDGSITTTITTSSLEPATPVPLESDALPVLASAAFMAGGMWWKRKRAQAKVPELVAHKDHLKV